MPVVSPPDACHLGWVALMPRHHIVISPDCRVALTWFPFVCPPLLLLLTLPNNVAFVAPHIELLTSFFFDFRPLCSPHNLLMFTSLPFRPVPQVCLTVSSLLPCHCPSASSPRLAPAMWPPPFSSPLTRTSPLSAAGLSLSIYPPACSLPQFPSHIAPPPYFLCSLCALREACVNLLTCSTWTGRAVGDCVP